jgi:hypothetical protein
MPWTPGVVGLSLAMHVAGFALRDSNSAAAIALLGLAGAYQLALATNWKDSASKLWGEAFARTTVPRPPPTDIDLRTVRRWAGALVVLAALWIILPIVGVRIGF